MRFKRAEVMTCAVKDKLKRRIRHVAVLYGKLLEKRRKVDLVFKRYFIQHFFIISTWQFLRVS